MKTRNSLRHTETLLRLGAWIAVAAVLTLGPGLATDATDLWIGRVLAWALAATLWITRPGRK